MSKYVLISLHDENKKAVSTKLLTLWNVCVGPIMVCTYGDEPVHTSIPLPRFTVFTGRGTYA